MSRSVGLLVIQSVSDSIRQAVGRLVFYSFSLSISLSESCLNLLVLPNRNQQKNQSSTLEKLHSLEHENDVSIYFFMGMKISQFSLLARNVSFGTLCGGQFTSSTQLIILEYFVALVYF